MMGSGLLTLMREANQQPAAQVDLSKLVTGLGHAMIMGILLVAVTAAASARVRRILDRKLTSVEPPPESPVLELMGWHNLLFLTVGLAGVMILISDSFLRAFAILAAIALVRFRIKIDNKSLGSSMIFAILAGMSCGVGESMIGYVSLVVYVLCLLVMLTTLTVSAQTRVQETAKKRALL